MYLDNVVKLPLFLVETLKAMNAIYPKTSSDFDMEFLNRLLRGIYTKAELKNCASQRSLKVLNVAKLKFSKGIFY